MEVRVQYLEKTKFVATARGHRIVCDQPPSNGGADEGPTPPEFLLVSLGTCAGFYAAQYLKNHGLPQEGLEVAVSAEKSAAPARLGRFLIDIQVPALPAEHESGAPAFCQRLSDQEHAGASAHDRDRSGLECDCNPLELQSGRGQAGGDRARPGVVGGRELRAVIDRVIAELPPLYRVVVLLRDLEELSTEDTAQVLDLSPDVVRTRLHRGRAAMRQKLDCYVNNHCLEDQPSPNPKPLTADERAQLFATWKQRQPVT
jgi:hypothetical protein